MANYKALQNKAMHKGMFIGYVVAKQYQYTTNGHIMVLHVATPDELKPLKSQQDRRIDGSSMVDFTMVIDKLNSETHVAMTDIGEEWTNEAGLKLSRVKGYDQAGDRDITIDVQIEYVDYVMALFDVKQWYITDKVLFAVDKNDVIVAVIGKVKEIVNG